MSHQLASPTSADTVDTFRPATAPMITWPIELDVELDVVLALVRGIGDGVVNVGHGRDPASIRRAQAFVEAWGASDGLLGNVVSWPPTAASWLRQAVRLASGADIWVVADSVTGWAGIGPRLAETGRWRADRTIAFPGLDDPRLPALAGHAAVEGMRGVTTDGRVWTNDGRRLHITSSSQDVTHDPRPDPS